MMIWTPKSQPEPQAEPSTYRMGETQGRGSLATVAAAWPTSVAQVAVTPEPFKSSKQPQE